VSIKNDTSEYNYVNYSSDLVAKTKIIYNVFIIKNFIHFKKKQEKLKLYINIKKRIKNYLFSQVVFNKNYLNAFVH